MYLTRFRTYKLLYHPKRKPGGGGLQTDKHLPQSLFTFGTALYQSNLSTHGGICLTHGPNNYV
jgi:hypothetical protein